MVPAASAPSWCSTASGLADPSATAVAATATALRAAQRGSGPGMSARILSGEKGWPHVLLGRGYDPDAGLAAAERAGAWSAWRTATADLGPETLIRIVGEAGLRGRGGGAFPTADKWRTCRAQPSATRYVVANGYEADPGSATDRTLMETDRTGSWRASPWPHMPSAPRARYVAVRTDATVAVRRLAAALRDAEEAGLLGVNALGKGIELLSSCASCRAPSSSARRPSCYEPSRASVRCPTSGRQYPVVKGLWRADRRQQRGHPGLGALDREPRRGRIPQARGGRRATTWST